MGVLPPLVGLGFDLSREEIARSARHLALPGIGADGQRRLAAARVLVVGAGGLDSPALLYLAAAGVGTIGIVDDDAVDRSNLQRQVIHRASDVGAPKTASARAAIADANPAVRVVEHSVRLSPANALDVLRGYDLVLDGSDNFATRYLVSDAAEILGPPVVWGGVHRFDGQVSVFWAHPPVGDGVTYRDVFPSPPPAHLAPSCATAGVLGALCGVIGSTMAVEAVKLITGSGDPLLGRIAVHDALGATWRQVPVRADPTRLPVTELPDDDAYATLCGLAEPSDPPPAIRPADVGPDAFVLDVREPWEREIAPVPADVALPSAAFLDRDSAVGTAQPSEGSLDDDVAAARAAVTTAARGRRIHVLCRTGQRASRVAGMLTRSGLDAVVVAGGVLAWARDVDPSIPAY